LACALRTRAESFTFRTPQIRHEIDLPAAILHLHPFFFLSEWIISRIKRSHFCAPRTISRIKSPFLPNPVRSRRTFRPSPGLPLRVSAPVDEYRSLDFLEERLSGADDPTAF